MSPALSRHSVRASLIMIVGLLLLGLIPGRAAADVCVTIDETRDNLPPRDRDAALLLLTRQFELAGEHVVPPVCGTMYVVSHVQLGTTITVTLSGPNGQRDATARGLDDLPAVYSQMVRSLLSGKPMDASGIVDRGNVSATQAEAPNRVYSDSLYYARLGYGAIFGDRTYGGPSAAMFGYRREFDSFGIDVSFFNIQTQPSDTSYSYSYPYSQGSSGTANSWLTLEFLHFITPLAGRSPYMGGGLSWSNAELHNAGTTSHGSGLQGELTLGYEVGRTSTIRVFFQLDAGLPFYKLRSDTYVYSASSPYPVLTSNEHRYAPSASFSLGLGWQHGGK